MEQDLTQLTQGFIDSLVGQTRETMARVEEVEAELRDLTVTVSSPDRHVTVVVAPGGKILKLTLDPRIYRQPDSSGLAAKIVDTIRRARSEVDEQENEIRLRIMPEAEALGAAVGFDLSEVAGPVSAVFGKDEDDVTRR